ELPVSSPLAKITVKTYDDFVNLFSRDNSLWAARTNYIDKLGVVRGDVNKFSLIGVDVWSSLYSIDAATGVVQWKFDDPEGASLHRNSNYSRALVIDDPRVGDARIIYANGRNHVLCLRARDGSLLWKYETSGQVYTTPVLMAAKPAEAPNVLVADDSSVMYTLNPATGELISKQTLPLLGALINAPTVTVENGAPQILAGSDAGSLGDFLPDGTIQWKVNLNSPITIQPVLTRNHSRPRLVIAATLEGRVYALSMKDGSLVWQYPKGDSPFKQISQPVIAHLTSADDEQIIFGTELKKYSHVTAGSVVSLDAQTGNLIWEHPMAVPVYGSFVVTDINLDGFPDVIGETGGVVNTAYALDGRNGAPLFEIVDKKFLENPSGVSSIVIQPLVTKEYPTVPSKASPTPLLYDLNGDGKLEIVFLDHDYTGLAVYQTLTPVPSGVSEKSLIVAKK
ncbi:MAG: PQQ-binding-like beta-propeller repeat protein, partial [Acidobacteriia bacterium]|nr:PQQ-binding-like beta-propeller repeat protein [Terriglobia bacterium]